MPHGPGPVPHGGPAGFAAPPASAPPYPMSPAAGPMSPAAGPYPGTPAFPQSAYAVPPTGGYQPGALVAPGTPRSISRVRLVLLAISILMIPNVALWLYSSILTGDFAQQGAFNEPTFYVAIACTLLVLAIPLGTVPTVLSWQIGRGRNWARIASVVVFGLVGPFCSCFGLLLPFTSLGGEGAASASPAMDAGLGIFSLALGVLSVVVAIMLFLPQSNQFFRNMGQWRRVKAAAVRRA
jgi:hypothetical protein